MILMKHHTFIDYIVEAQCLGDIVEAPYLDHIAEAPCAILKLYCDFAFQVF